MMFATRPAAINAARSVFRLRPSSAAFGNNNVADAATTQQKRLKTSSPEFDAVVKKAFPGAISNTDLVNKVVGVLEGK
eukprot:scaffold3659_cov88-Skeletonema_marinoi.AAC.1